jgi:hypothetical protein
VSEPIDPGVIEPAAYVDACVLLERGADHGRANHRQNARLTAQFFELPVMTALLDGARR